MIAEAGKPVGPIVDGDSVVFYNFRGDRAIEITRAFVEASFDKFDRARTAGHLRRHAAVRRRPQTARALPRRPPAIQNTAGEWFAKSGIAQYACSETQKFGHVTYFWNGNRSNRFDGEVWEEVPSDVVPFEQRPWMKAAEIADAMIAAVHSGNYRALRCNFANGDMVGHTGNFRAATMAVEAVDLALGRLLAAIDAAGGVALITADHGNADEMFELDKKTGQPAQNKDGSFRAKTAHAQPGAAHPVRQGGGRAVAEADRDGGPFEPGRHDGQPARFREACELGRESASGWLIRRPGCPAQRGGGDRKFLKGPVRCRAECPDVGRSLRRPQATGCRRGDEPSAEVAAGRRAVVVAVVIGRIPVLAAGGHRHEHDDHRDERGEDQQVEAHVQYSSSSPIRLGSST